MQIVTVRHAAQPTGVTARSRCPLVEWAASPYALITVGGPPLYLDTPDSESVAGSERVQPQIGFQPLE